jgi:hypothetical protein
MATAELTATGEPGGRRQELTLPRAVAAVYLSLWAVTLTAAGVTVACDLGGPVRGALGLRVSPTGTPAPTWSAVAELALHNLPICAWPLVLPAAGACRTRGARLAAHALVAASLSANAMLIGVAIGAYGSRLLPYVPQLPLEWLALAAGAAGWVAPSAWADRRVRVEVAALIGVALLAAAAVETYAVPHTAEPTARGPSSLEGGQIRAVGDIHMNREP